MAKIAYLPEKWIVIYHEKMETGDRMVEHREYFSDEENAEKFLKSIEIKEGKQALKVVRERVTAPKLK